MSETPAAEDQMTPALQSAAMARKKRRIARNKQRSKEEAADDVSFPDQKRPRTESDDASDDTSPVLLIDPETSKPKPHVTGIKKHSRYDPGVPMTRDELKAWRKEARRVRNRESAAASRLKNRERIDELESEVDALKAKYAAALKFICNLEAGVVNDSFTPQSLRQDLADMAVSAGLSSPRPATPDLRHVKTVVSPPMSPSSAGEEEQQQQHHAEEVNQKYQHIMDMISRPIACV